MGKFIGGVVLVVFLFFGISSCNLGESKGECPVGGCVDGPKQTEFEPLDPEFEFVVP